MDVIITARLVENVWETSVFLNGERVGGGTSQSFLDTAADILYGDKNDWLNGSQGALGDVLTRSESPSGAEVTPKDSGGGR